MNSQQLTPGTPVIYWPIRRPDGTFEGEPLHTSVKSHAWNNHGTEVCMIEGKSGFVAIAHLELQKSGTWEIIQEKRDPSGEFLPHSKRDGFKSRIAALDKFGELTAGGFEEPNPNTIYRWVFREMGEELMQETFVIYTVD